MKTSNLKKGSILSETSFFVVEKVLPDGILVKDDNGTEVEIGNDYVEQILNSADYYETEEEKTMTELADIFKQNARIAMTVAFYKKDEAKTKKVYEAEVKQAIEKVQNAKVSEVEGLLRNLIENPVSKIIPGELRVMKGRHYGGMNDLGRIDFIDMELPSTDAMKGIRQVDPRTIQYLIVNKVKYNLKKK